MPDLPIESPLAGISQPQTPPPPVPNPQNLPVTTRTSPQSPVQAAPPVDKHALLGRIVSHIRNSIEGQQTVYTPDPNTGTVVESTQPRKPGAIFRDLLGGMLSGMAASATAGNANPSGAAGLGLGFEGAQQNRLAMQDRSRDQAQRNATAMQQRKQVLDQQQVAAAQVAQNTVSSLNIGHFVPHFSDEEISDYNGSVNSVRKILMDNGGQMADVQQNGVKGNGPALMKAYNSDPTILAGPEGFHRVASIVYDTDGLKHVGHQWVNQDGSQLSPDEWNKRGTVYLTDVPNAVWSKNVTLNGRTIQDVAPGSQLVKDPNRNYSTSIGSIFALGLRNKSDMIKARDELYSIPKDSTDLSQRDQRLQDIQARLQSDPLTVTPDEKRWAAVQAPIISRAKAQQPAKPVTVNNLNDARSMLDSDKPQEVSAAKSFFLSSLSGPDGDKMAAFISADPHFLPAERKIAKDWAKSYAAIKATERPEKPEKPEKPADMVIGSIGGKPVAVPFDEASNYKWDAGGRPTKAGAAESEKVNNARSLINVFDSGDPDDLGLLQLAAKLDQEGKLGPIMTRFQQWLNKGNSVANFNAGDPDVQRLFTKMGLSTTGLMQVHVGARGSAQMLEHFEDLAKAKEMSSSAFRTALDTEARYVRMKAMLPSAQRTTSAPNETKPTKSNPSLVQSLIQKHSGAQ